MTSDYSEEMEGFRVLLYGFSHIKDLQNPPSFDKALQEIKPPKT